MLRIDDTDDLNETLLLHKIARHLRTCFDRRVQHLGFTRAQWRVLCILRRAPGMRQSALADIMEIEPMTLTRLLDRMQHAGWIERRADPTDRRAHSLHITGGTRDAGEEMNRLARDLRSDALAGFSEEEHRALIGYLQRIKANVSKMLEAKYDHE